MSTLNTNPATVPDAPSFVPAGRRLDQLRATLPEVEWLIHAPLIERIQVLKAERNAVILAHNYQKPEIYHGVADFTGDSLALAREAARCEAQVIVQCGVHFMAETSKILAPGKTVLLPDLGAGCSLAASITGEDVRRLRQRYPGVPVVVYVNTSAEVKAEADICCTSSNAVEVVESLGTDRVIFAPDRYLGQWVASQTDIDIILYDGSCEVHEKFSAAEIATLRAENPGVYVLAHPECPMEVLDAADFVGSTAAMSRQLDKVKTRQVVMITECSMSDNVAIEHPELDFIRPCNLCPHMNRITLPKIIACLEILQPEITVPTHIIGRARESVERMLAV
ncbi:MAG: quinolinate synthase NadA [Wenzhouxiangella sp.]